MFRGYPFQVLVQGIGVWPAVLLSSAAFALAQSLARIAVAAPRGGPEPVVVLREPCVELAGVRVPVPPGAFLQATAEGERALMAAVAAAVLCRPSLSKR